MNLKEMRAKVQAELEHIPKQPKPHQSELRMIYFTTRMNSLGKKAKREKTATDVLYECIDRLGDEYPDADFQYDRVFFKRERKKGR